MEKTKNKKTLRRLALILSLCALFVWGLFGTGASLAWFSDTSPDIHNIFHFAEFDVEVSHRLTDGTWDVIDSQEKVFDEALYEPGYVQVVYLKVKNKGTVPFTFDTGMTVTGYTLAKNVFGQTFNLQDYLMFGLTVAKSEAEMKANVPDREAAKIIANSKLDRYFETDNDTVLGPNEEAFVTLVVRMPEEVNNVANYRGDDIPTVELGLIVKAEQADN